MLICGRSPQRSNPWEETHIEQQAYLSQWPNRVIAHRAGLPEHVTSHTLRHSVALHYLMGGAPITFVQNLLGYESPSAPPFDKPRREAPPELDEGPVERLRTLLRTGLATTDIYVQLMDQMAKEITLNTKTAIDEIEPREEGELLKETKDLYEAEFEGWDDFVDRVLEWL